jgi:hypothetical protein
MRGMGMIDMAYGMFFWPGDKGDVLNAALSGTPQDRAENEADPAGASGRRFLRMCAAYEELVAQDPELAGHDAAPPTVQEAREMLGLEQSVKARGGVVLGFVDDKTTVTIDGQQVQTGRELGQ